MDIRTLNIQLQHTLKSLIDNFENKLTQYGRKSKSK